MSGGDSLGVVRPTAAAGGVIGVVLVGVVLTRSP